MAKKANKEILSESELLYELLWKKYNAVDVNKIIFTQILNDGTYEVKIGGKKVTGTQLQNLKNEASVMSKMAIWELMETTMQNAAHQHMFAQMKTLEDSHYGKTILYSLSIFNTILRALDNPHIEKVPVSATTQFAAQRYPKT